MINISNGQSGGGGLRQGGQYLPFMRFDVNKVIGASKRSDGTTNADGTLYPKNVNPRADIGDLQTYFDAQMNTNLQDIGFGRSTNIYTNNQLKVMVGENYFAKYKRLIYLKLSQMLKQDASTADLFTAVSSSNIPGKFVALDSTHFAMIYMRSGSALLWAVVGTVASDGTITWGTPASISTSSAGVSSNTRCDACLINTNKVAVIYEDSTGKSILSVVFTVSGTTITPGTEVSLYGTYYLSNQQMSIAKLANDSFMAVYNITNGTLLAGRAATVSGTTITYGTQETVSNNTGNCYFAVDTANTKGLVFFDDRSSGSVVVAFSWSGTAITFGTKQQLAGNLPLPTTNRAGYVQLIETDKYLIVGGSGTMRTITLSTLTISQQATVTHTNFSNNHEFVMQVVTAGSEYVLYSQTRALNFLLDTDKNPQSATAVTKSSPSSISNALNGFVDTKLITLGQYSNLNLKVGYNVSDDTNTEVYNDATLASTVTPGKMKMASNTHFIDAQISGKKLYLGIKNIGGLTKSIVLDEVCCEVE